MNLSILVGSCDEYHFLWEKFTYLFNKYWDHNIKINKKFLLTQDIHFDNDTFETICTGHKPWTQRLQDAINKIDSDYILWLQDDYFFTRTIPLETFSYYFDFILKNNVHRFGIHDSNEMYYLLDDNTGYSKYSQYSYYTISLQASIWNKNFLSLCINNDQSPWEFELHGSQTLNSTLIHNIYLSIQNPSWYREAMKRGKYTDDYYYICAKESI